MTDIFVFSVGPNADGSDHIHNSQVFSLLENLQDRLEGQKPQWIRLSDQVLRFIFPTNIPARPLLQDPAFMQFQKDQNLECVVLSGPRSPDPPYLRPLRAAVFDMDSTLIEQEVIDELAASIGVKGAVAAITERAMRGELDFAASLKARVSLLEGVRADVWDTLKSRITIAKGARELCRGLKRMGVKMVVLSGGFQPMADWVKDELALNKAVANQLHSSEYSEKTPFPHLTGALQEGVPIVTATRKRELLKEFASEHGVPLSEVLCVGDGANDLEMIGEVGSAGGMGVAFKAKEQVQLNAPNRLNTSSLEALLYLTGRNEEEIKSLIVSE